MPKIAICLANSPDVDELSDFLDKLVAQSLSDWHLYASANAVGAARRLSALATRYSGQVTIVAAAGDRMAGVGEMMARTREPYVAVVDSGDALPPDWLATRLAALLLAEQRHGVSTPALVCAGANGDGVPVFRPGPARYLAGSAARREGVMINRPLLDVAHPLAEAACSDAAWLVLVAAGFGVVTVLPDASMGDWGYALTQTLERQRLSCLREQRQVAAFHARYRGSLTRKDARRLALFVSLPRRSLAGRIATLWRSGGAPAGLGSALAYARASGGARAARWPGVSPATIPRPADP